VRHMQIDSTGVTASSGPPSLKRCDRNLDSVAAVRAIQVGVFSADHRNGAVRVARLRDLRQDGQRHGQIVKNAASWIGRLWTCVDDITRALRPERHTHCLGIKQPDANGSSDNQNHDRDKDSEVAVLPFQIRTAPGSLPVRHLSSRLIRRCRPSRLSE
jgi:hypothetical protein